MSEVATVNSSCSNEPSVHQDNDDFSFHPTRGIDTAVTAVGMEKGELWLSLTTLLHTCCLYCDLHEPRQTERTAVLARRWDGSDNTTNSDFNCNAQFNMVPKPTKIARLVFPKWFELDV